MKDKEIRKILIAYLQTQGQEMRIYQEKSIGTSICDLMVVTDRLTGYEIKSDSDDYARLPQQVKTYNRFFERNYLVVGRRHAESVKSKVPDEWGIICIERDDVTELRPAKDNKLVSVRAQLSVLWKLELKNILLKNRLPVYAQKAKGYISDRIVEGVEDGTLRKQIAYELLHRDYSVFEGATDYSIYTEGLAAEMPARELVDMLSENDLQSFTLDKWINLYKQARELQEQKQTLYTAAPVERIPHEIPYTDIEVSLGAPWISVNIINAFIAHLIYDCEDWSVNLCKYEPVTGNWYIENKHGWCSSNMTVKYGTERYNALYILEASLNLREIKLCDRSGKYDEPETVAALEKQKKIEEEFRNWIWLDDDRRWEVEEAYNKLFCGYKKEKPDGSALVFEGMREECGLYDYQKDAVQKILESKNTLLAFDVGAGKTYIMIAAAMKMRRDGLSRRNMFVVPNHIVGQWEKIFTDLYPAAKILAIEPKTFKPEMRQKILRQIKEGDYDGVIIAYSCFEMIPLCEDTVLDNMTEQLKTIEEAIGDLRSTGNTLWSRKTLEKEKSRIVQMTMDFIKNMCDPKRPDQVTFSDLEISTLFLDEAHNYKNLPIRTKLKNLNGINTRGSAKCLDMLHKVRCVQNSANGRGAVFATGTPLCNSISDAYTMQVYLQYEDLERGHLDQFDNWVKTFAKPEQLMEIDVDTSKYRMIRKFSRFHNLPELSRMFSGIAVFYAVDGDESLPQFDGYTDVVIKKYAALTDYMHELCKRTEEIRSGKIDRKFDNMLKVSTDGRKASLDLRLVGREMNYNETSKVFNCVKNVVNVYNRYPGCTQLIFCDYSTPKGTEFSVYKELQTKLAEEGIPEREIAFIHSYNTESRKLELFRKFNAGEMRVLIGSTFKLGIGANVQIKLKAIHHLDVPWRPADMVQREGRIIRRGNESETVLIYRYITAGSFDSYSWQILETKQRFISQFLSGSAYQRSITDLEDNVLSYAEVKALALAEPLMKQLAEKENEVKSLRIVVTKEEETIAHLKAEEKDCSARCTELWHDCVAAERTQKYLEKCSEEKRRDAFNKLKELLTSDFIAGRSDDDSFTVLCFTIVPSKNPSEKKSFIILKDEGVDYTLEMGTSTAGNARRVTNFITGFDKTIHKMREDARSCNRRYLEIRRVLQQPDSTNRRLLSSAESELAELKERIRMNMNPTVREKKEEWE